MLAMSVCAVARRASRLLVASCSCFLSLVQSPRNLAASGPSYWLLSLRTLACACRSLILFNRSPVCACICLAALTAWSVARTRLIGGTSCSFRWVMVGWTLDLTRAQRDGDVGAVRLGRRRWRAPLAAAGGGAGRTGAAARRPDRPDHPRPVLAGPVHRL